jgi:3-oxoacyl-[acyl-carrier-protein] synthase III
VFKSGRGLMFGEKVLGISGIGVHIPVAREDNCQKKELFNFEEKFLEEKIGVFRISKKEEEEETSDLCVKAFYELQKKKDIDKNEIDVIIVVTQNPDIRMPHTGAIVHSKLDLPPSCASFDVSLGCSGYVYGLSTIIGFMKENDLKKGILFTCDPYSKIVDPNDRNTALLFGDAATATLIDDNPELVPGKFSFGTLGSKWEEIRLVNEKLFMNGQAVVRFAKRYIPVDIRKTVVKNGLSLDQIDKFVFHQGSKFIVDILSEDLGIESERVPFDIKEYGNTVSSSIPIILEKELENKNTKNFLLCGFGIGLSWGSCVVNRICMQM